MIRPVRPINVNSAARKVEVDNRFPIHVYYRIADNILRQANIYREEKNIVDLYIMLLRFSSLVSETIPFHRDYQSLHRKESVIFKKKLHAVLDELECLKPEFKLCIDDINKSWNAVQRNKNDGYYVTSTLSNSTSFLGPSNNNEASVTFNDYKPVVTSGDHDYWKQPERQSHKLSLSLPPPKKDTLSRHSFLGPNGLAGQWTGPIIHTKVHYPNNTDLVAVDNIGLSQIGKIVSVPEKENYSKSMEAVLSLDDGRWTNPIEKEIYKLDIEEKADNMQFDIVRQPSPPPIPTKLQQDYLPISSSKVADPRPGPPSHSQDHDPNSGSYQDLHIPVKMMDEFLRLVRENTMNNLETCGVLAGSLKNRVFHITTLIIPKQESTSDSCQTLNEEEIFEAQDKFSLFPLGWIHTHPTQTCFMSSVDLHTHYSYQIMLPEAVAIVMAPSDTASPHGIFHLSDPGGVSVIRKCQQRGFHPHEEPADGSHIYEKCSHVYINPSLNFDVVDLRTL